MKKRPEKVILEHYRFRYQYSKQRHKKQELLNDFCTTYAYHRKAAVRLLNGGDYLSCKYRKRPGPSIQYCREEVLPTLKVIWLATDQMCSKKLKAALPLWLPHYEAMQGLLPEKLKLKLLSISPATIDRLIKPLRLSHKRKGLSGTRPGSLLKNKIAIKTDHWDITQPGYLEADTVAHCGNSLLGNFAWSVTLTDIFCGWTEIRAVWNKGAAGILEQISVIEEILPFDILGFDCDNGTEFLNHHLVAYFTERKKKVQFTRSRPYKKDDNAHVEQKNWTHVRQLFGYDRFDNSILIPLMNDLYANEWSLLQNYFCPSMKLVEKVKINSRYRKKYDIPQTPYHRLLASTHISNEKKKQLIETFRSLNPFQLKQSIERKLRTIFQYVKVTPNMRQRL